MEMIKVAMVQGMFVSITGTKEQVHGTHRVEKSKASREATGADIPLHSQMMQQLWQ